MERRSAILTYGAAVGLLNHCHRYMNSNKCSSFCGITQWLHTAASHFIIFHACFTECERCVAGEKEPSLLGFGCVKRVLHIFHHVSTGSVCLFPKCQSCFSSFSLSKILFQSLSATAKTQYLSMSKNDFVFLCFEMLYYLSVLTAIFQVNLG